MATETLFNLKELDAVFEGLKYSTQKSIVVSAFRKAATPLIEEAKINVTSRIRSKTGNLRKSFGIKPFSKEIGIQAGARTTCGFKGYHATILDAGTVFRYRKTKGGKMARTGKIKAYNFWSDAVNSNKDKIEESITDELFSSLDRYITKNLQRIST